ncbi:TetR/AcrR family transcriptional regulator [Paenibacillus sp. sgz500958]|uniref:TetR/AcrR family transcriptional regulator n=1 Tax=Paenibacillus sp. sgz500958 TaxID=3242475 RepID=UPI0036D323B5
MSPKEDISLNRKEQILESAAALFATQGYYKTTTAHVAEAIGVTQPYVFHFFKTKEQLYLAVLERAYERMEYAFKQVEAAPEKLCEVMGDAFVALLDTHRNEMLLLMQSSSHSEPGIRQTAKEKYARIYDFAFERFEGAGIPDPAAEARRFISYGLMITLSATLDLPQLMP